MSLHGYQKYRYKAMTLTYSRQMVQLWFYFLSFCPESLEYRLYNKENLGKLLVEILTDRLALHMELEMRQDTLHKVCFLCLIVYLSSYPSSHLCLMVHL